MGGVWPTSASYWITSQNPKFESREIVNCFMFSRDLCYNWRYISERSQCHKAKQYRDEMTNAYLMSKLLFEDLYSFL